MTMNPLDGNAIAGPLLSFYGTEMTAAEGACRHCGHVSRVAELRVYLGGPGTVARCPTCDGVVLVVTEIGEQISVSSDGFAFGNRT
jgi:hypothetical protein